MIAIASPWVRDMVFVPFGIFIGTLYGFLVRKRVFDIRGVAFCVE